jgi:hypothetical protein
MRPLVWLSLLAAVLIQGTIPLDSQTLACSTWQGITTCQGQGSYGGSQPSGRVLCRTSRRTGRDGQVH